MLVFAKTDDHHPFLPARALDGGDTPSSSGLFGLYNPWTVRLLPGQKTVVDFLLTVTLPPHCRGELRLKPSVRESLCLHAPLLRRCPKTLCTVEELTKRCVFFPDHCERPQNLVVTLENVDSGATFVLTAGECLIELLVSVPWKGGVRGAFEPSDFRTPANDDYFDCFRAPALPIAPPGVSRAVKGASCRRTLVYSPEEETEEETAPSLWDCERGFTFENLVAACLASPPPPPPPLPPTPERVFEPRSPSPPPPPPPEAMHTPQ